MKKILSLILSLVMLVCSVICVDLSTYAVEATNEINIADYADWIPYLEKVLNSIPNTIELDIPEIEHERTHDLVSEQLVKSLNDNGIGVTKVNSEIITDISLVENHYVAIEYCYDYPSVYGFREINNIIKIVDITDNHDHYSEYSKVVELVYNNTQNYNKADEEYIKNLKLTSPTYYEVDLDYLTCDNPNDIFYDKASQYYTSQIDDESVTIQAYARAGGREGTPLNLWTYEGGTHLIFFKNDVFYEDRMMGQECCVPVINIPDSVSDSEINNYIISEITKYYKKTGESITSVKKGANHFNTDIVDGYTVYHENGPFGGPKSEVIARRENNHTHAWDSGTVTTAPTCTQEGIKTFTCSCGETYTEAIPAIGHNFGDNNPNCVACGVANPNYVPPTTQAPPVTDAPTVPVTHPSITAKPKEKPPVKGAQKVNGEWINKRQKNASVKKLKKAKKSFKAEWKKLSGVKGYQIQYSTDKKFKKNTKKNTKKVTVKGNKATSKTIKKLKGGKKYYVRVRTYKTYKVNKKAVNVYSKWSKAKAVTVKK